MQETELKFQVPVAARAAVAAAVAGAQPAKRVRLQASYVDTADRALAAAGLALRVRREGRRWVQTLKGAGSDGMTRAEHNVVLTAAAGDVPQPDPSLHAGTAVGERLSATLASAGESRALLCLYRTDIWRRTRQLKTGAGTVELAFDEGFIAAGERRLAVRELEIELLAGSPLAVIDTAAQWLPRHGLWLDTRTKAERGDLLARGEPMAPPRHVVPVRLRDDASVAQGQHAVLASCADQVSVNASQVASGDFSAEHLHQLRVGLRRLRTALRLFEPAAAALAEPAATLFRQLGAARDADAVAAPLAQALGDAMRSVGQGGALPPVPAAAASDPAACVRAGPAQALLLGLLRELQRHGDGTGDGAGSALEAPLHAHASATLQRWHRQVKADAKRFATLDEEARHALRKRAKRLRYAAEFMAALYPKKAVAAYLKPLRRLQERLGELNDIAVGIEAFRGAADSDPRALFALGWLASRRDALLLGCEPQLAAFRDAKRFWRK